MTYTPALWLERLPEFTGAGLDVLSAASCVGTRTCDSAGTASASLAERGTRECGR